MICSIMTATPAYCPRRIITIPGQRFLSMKDFKATLPADADLTLAPDLI